MEFAFSPLLGILIAGALGGAVGIQRQAAAKPAGFRTHVLVAAASAGFTAMGAHLHDTRIPSYIVVGIGFLGAGAIVRHGTSAQGLTTAASIWMVAAIGLALGYSNSFGLAIGVLLTVLTLIALVLSDDEILRVFRIPHRATLQVTCNSLDNAMPQITRALEEARIRVQQMDIVSLTADGATQLADLRYLIALQRGEGLQKIMREIGALSTVLRVECDEPTPGT